MLDRLALWIYGREWLSPGLRLLVSPNPALKRRACGSRMVNR